MLKSSERNPFEHLLLTSTTVILQGILPSWRNAEYQHSRKPCRWRSC